MFVFLSIRHFSAILSSQDQFLAFERLRLSSIHGYMVGRSLNDRVCQATANQRMTLVFLEVATTGVLNIELQLASDWQEQVAKYLKVFMCHHNAYIWWRSASIAQDSVSQAFLKLKLHQKKSSRPSFWFFFDFLAKMDKMSNFQAFKRRQKTEQ